MNDDEDERRIERDGKTWEEGDKSNIKIWMKMRV